MKKLNVTRTEMLVQGLALFSIGCLLKKYVDGEFLAGDWLAYWTAGKAVVSGVPERLYDIGFFTQTQAPYLAGVCPFLYAPAFAIPFAPLALMPIEFARFAWFVTNVICLFASVRVARNWTTSNDISPIAAFIGYTPIMLALYIGQVTLVLLLAIALIIRDELNHQLNLKSGLFAGIILLKPQLLPICFLFWLMRKKWKALSGLFISVFLILTGSVVLDPATILNFLEARHSLGPVVFENVVNRGINPTLYSAVGSTSAVVTAFVILMVLFFLWSGKITREYLALIWTAPLLLTPYLGIHDFGLLVLPATLVYPVADKGIKTTLILCWLTPFLLLMFGNSYHPAIWPVLAFFCALAYSIWQAEKTQLPGPVDREAPSASIVP